MARMESGWPPGVGPVVNFFPRGTPDDTAGFFRGQLIVCSPLPPDRNYYRRRCHRRDSDGDDNDDDDDCDGLFGCCLLSFLMRLLCGVYIIPRVRKKNKFCLAENAMR